MKSPSKNPSGTASSEYWIIEDLEEWLTELSELDDLPEIRLVQGVDGMRWLACDSRKELCFLY